jgi:arginine utilization regulatory protein
MLPRAIKQLFAGIDPATISLLPVLDDFHEGIMITDAQGVVLYMNAAQARIDDLKAGDAVGRTVSELYRVDEGTSPTMTCLKTGRVIANLACYYRTHLGRVVNSIHNVYPIRSSGRIIGAVCCITDYRNLEPTIAAIGKYGPSRAIATFGVSPVAGQINPKDNGTRYTFDDIIGSDTDLQAAVNTAQLASDSPSPIMIFGETGTGKEMIAQAIHNRSMRKSSLYVAVNCAAIPENLLEGMLFGTSKGAFTGAIDKPGLLETADGGTLFLDEINSMSTGLQAKLLRFLQERKVRRIGAVQEVDVNLKILSSVNVPPHEAIEAGTLRADLFYRLAVVFISMPPLRARKRDLNPLVAHFLAVTNNRLGKRVAGIAMDVMNRFERHAWPGNVRQLAHVIEGAMNMMVDERTIQMQHLSMPLDAAQLSPAVTADIARPADPAGGTVNIVFAHRPADAPQTDLTLNQIKTEKETGAIVAALTATRGNAAEAARRLGISPQLMHYKLKRFGIDRRAFRNA